MFRRKSATRTENLLQYLANAQQEQQLKGKRLIAQTAAVDEKNADLATKRDNLENLLKSALAQDTTIDLDSLKKAPRVPAFDKKRPMRRSYLPKPPSSFGSLLPWKKKAYDRQYLAAEAKYIEDRHSYDQALDRHQKQVTRESIEIEAHNQEIERYKQDFDTGKPQAVEDYFARVLEESAYPAGFPKQTKLAYDAEVEELRIDFALPALEAIPETKTYELDQIRGGASEVALPRKQRRLLYSSVLAQICLRTIYEVFTADRMNKVDRILFEGYADGAHPASGKPGRFCLVSLDITRPQFDSLDLAQVEPRACLKGLNARLSSKPDLLLAVPPMTQDDNEVAPVARGSDSLHFKQRISELEDRIESQSAHITELESKLEEQRDRIAALAPDLRDEQERNAELFARVQEQREHIADLESELQKHKDAIAELESPPTEEPDDTQPIETFADASADSDFAEAAIFTPLVSNTADDGAGGARIPPRPPVVDQPVTLRDLLQGTDGSRANSDGEAMALPGDLPYLRELVTTIGALEGDEAKLLALMMRSDWACSEQSVRSAFPRQFISAIVHDINERVYDVIEDNLIEEEGGLLVVAEEFRDALEQALTLTDNQTIEHERNRR